MTKPIGAFRSFPDALVGDSADWNVERVLREVVFCAFATRRATRRNKGN